MRKYLLFWLTLALLLSELALNLEIVYGFVLYCLLVLAILIFLSHEEYLDNYGKLVSVIMIVPIARITELFLDFNMFWRSLIFYLGILIMASYYLFAFKISRDIEQYK